MSKPYLYEIYVDGKFCHSTANVNIHQEMLDFFHEQGKEPIEKRVVANYGN